MYNFNSFAMSSLEEGGWSGPCPARFTPGKDQAPTVQETGWAWKPPLTLGFDSRTVQFVSSRYSDCTYHYEGKGKGTSTQA